MRSLNRPVSLATLIGLTVILTLQAPAPAQEWTELGPAPITNGPWTGRCAAIIASPTNPDKWYVGAASGGVWRTTDAGLTWTPLTDHLPAAAIGALAFDPANENIIYAGTGEPNFANHCLYGLGIYKSTDGGDSWKILAGPQFSGRTFSRIIVSHTNSQVLYASITHAGGFYPTRNAAKNHPRADGPVGVFKSTDGGNSWTHLTNGVPAGPASDLVMDSFNPDVLYVALGDVFGSDDNGVYKTIDGGASWTKLTNGLPSLDVGRISLAIAPSNGKRLYTIFVNPSSEFGAGATTRGVYRTDDGGGSWVSAWAGSFQATYGWYLSVAAVHPNNPDLAFVGGLNLLGTENAGEDWDDTTPGHVDIHGLAFDASGRLLCANDGGVHMSTDNGNSWVARNDGLGVTQLYAGLSLHPTNRTFALAGLQDNGTCRRENDLEWSNRMGGDGGCTALHPSDPQVMLAEYQGTGNLYRSTDGGQSFGHVGGDITASDRNCFMPPVLHYHPTISLYMYYGTQRLWRSTTKGASWTAIGPDLTNGPPAAIRALAVAPSNYQTIYAATNDGLVLVSTTGGIYWVQILTDNPGWPRITRELAVDPADDSTVYLAVQHFGVDQVKKATGYGYGNTWTAIDDNLPDIPANCVAMHRTETLPILAVGTDNGVYISYTAEGAWRKLGPNLPNSPVIDLVFQPVFNRLVAGTLGRGVWEIPIPVFGDADGDADLDLADYAKLQACFSGPTDGPGFTPPSAECKEQFDLTFDGDVDMDDYVAAIPQFEGPA